MSVNIRPLSEDMKIIARTELNEVESRLPDEIQKFREWILMQPHLKVRTNDQFLLSFLRGSKHSLEKAKSKIDYYYTIKTMMPEVFKTGQTIEKIRDLAASGAAISPAHQPHIGGPEICITRIEDNFDFDRFKLIDMIRLRTFAMEYALQEVDNAVLNGFGEIFDFSKYSLKLYAQTDFVLFKKLAVFFEKGVPLRLKGLHVINCPKEGRDILLLFKSMLTEKYKKLFYVHKTLEDLHKYVPRDKLPVEYGGTNGTMAEAAAANARQLESYTQYSKENDQYCVDERLRPHKTIDEQSLFGLEGSFRKLDID